MEEMGERLVLKIVCRLLSLLLVATKVSSGWLLCYCHCLQLGNMGMSVKARMLQCLQNYSEKILPFKYLKQNNQNISSVVTTQPSLLLADTFAWWWLVQEIRCIKMMYWNSIKMHHQTLPSSSFYSYLAEQPCLNITFSLYLCFFDILS